MLKRTVLLTLGVLIAVAMLATAATAGMRSKTDGGTTTPSVDTGSALVVLKGDPLATSEKTKPSDGKKIDFSSTAVKTYRAQLARCATTSRRGCGPTCRRRKVTGEFDIALNAVGGQAQRHDAGAGRRRRRWCSARVPGPVLPARARRPRPGADQRARGLGAGRRRRQRRSTASRSRSSTPAST